MTINRERFQFPKLSRRDFLKLGLGYLSFETLLLAGLLKESERIGVNHYIYKDSTLPEEWDGTIVVQISDLHIGQRNLDPVDPDIIKIFQFKFKNIWS